MDAETRHTLAATILSTLVRVSFVFLTLCKHDRENDTSAQKQMRKRERERETEREGEEKSNHL